jgi:hypothetical protein
MDQYSPAKDIVSNSDMNSDNILWLLMILLGTNIVVEIIKLTGNFFLKNKDSSNQRKLLIETKRIEILEKLYQDLESLSLYDSSQTNEMLDKVKEISKYITSNKIFVTKKYQKISGKILDYFKNVMSDYRLKKIETETKLFQKFSDEFNR